MPLKPILLRLSTKWGHAACSVALMLLLFTRIAAAAPCDTRSNAPDFIEHDLSLSYCELCGYGYITITVSNPLEDADMLATTVVENLRSSGLTYDPTAPTPVTYSYVMSGSTSGPYAGGAPTISGANGSILTWTSAQIPALAIINYQDGAFLFDSVSITFAVTRNVALSQEGLINADRNIQARFSYSTSTTDPNCTAGETAVPSTLDTLPLREPNPVVTKRGRNIDANQGGSSWTETVYGHVNDDVIWRIEINNTSGTAPLQDLSFDDLMQDGSMDINYACPTYTAAADVALNNGSTPGGSPCVASSNSIINFDVDNPFGNPGSDATDEVDVPEAGSAFIYLVGKIRSAPEGSCTTNRTNTVSDIQWGCEVDNPAGGLFETSTGDLPGSSTTTLYTLYGERNPLSVQRLLTGVNTSQPVGSRGLMTIWIRNYTGGTVKGIQLADILPAEYVMDPTYPPDVRIYPRYGAYAGMIDNITWDNQAVDPLNNTAPEFTLTSNGCSAEGGGPCADTVHPVYADQQNMLRDGDRLRIRFRVVLIEPTHYDKVADIDDREESVADGNDPDNQTTLTNTLTVEFDTFCGSQGHQTLTFTGNGFSASGAAIPAYPEDLDIDIASTGELVFILTDDPTQRLPLTVNLTNNGGHDAEDYITYVAFGQTMDVVGAPSSCALTSNPLPHDEWQDPEPIPAGAAVYACTGSAIAPGQTISLDFEVIKSSDTADIEADDLTFRADVVGEIHLYDGTLLTFPTPLNPPDVGARSDGGVDIGNNYSLDVIRARVIGFNLLKSQVGNCSENNPPPSSPDLEVQIGEECTYNIEAGGWFGFQTPGWLLIAVQDVTVYDQLPNGQGYISSTDPASASTSGIQEISLHPPPVAPNEVSPPDYMNWTFNFGEGLRISERGHWFRANVTSRILNDPIDTSADPNRHAAQSINMLLSTFVGVFQREGWPTPDVVNLDQSTVGYPRAEVRTVTLTVTEPEISIVKMVCNEALYGTGPSCSNFVPSTDEGDAFNPYIYRITLTNETESDGVTRAPAYDVTVTDILDASDLALVIGFGSDGLDNDGDGSIDEAGEGTISDNIVKNGIPAQITFSYSHSTALARMDAGDSVTLYYRVDYDDDAAPLQVFTNTVRATYDSLEGPSGSQTVELCTNSQKCGARFYSSATADAPIQIVPVLTRPKEIIAVSNTPLASSGTQPVVVGEEVQYRLTTSLPVAQFRNFVIRDELPDGIRCAEAPAVNLDAPPYSSAGFQPGGTFAPTCTDSLVEWNFGDQRITSGTVGDRYDFELNFIARVENTADTNNTDVISNGDPATTATASYIDEDSNSIVLSYNKVDIRVTEPVIALTKSFTVANADAADILTVTVTAANMGTATAYNLQVYDNLVGRNMTYVGNVGGSNPPDNVDVATLGPNQPIFSWNAPNGINAGSSISFTFEIQVDNGVQPHEILDNTLQAAWTSLPGQTTALNSTGSIGANGSETGMRIGAIPNAGDAVNDYETTASAQTAVPVVSLDKTDLNAAAVPAIGQRKIFQLDIRLPEGVTNGVTATDMLNTAGISYVLENNATYDISYTFQGIATINGAAPGESAFNAFPADGAVDTITWNIGTVATQTENDTSINGINPLIRIQYYARVNNDLVTDNGDPLQNSVVANYTNGETGAQETLTDNTAAVTVVEPVLVPFKTVQNRSSANLDDPPAGGDLLEYVITISNTGSSTAYDVNVVDTIPAEISLYSGFTPTATIAGISVTGFVAAPAGAPDGPLTWGRGNGDNSLDIPSGQSLIITYQARLDAAGSDFANSVWVDWTSLDGPSNDERDGEGCPTTTDPDDYCAGPASATATSIDINDITKGVDADTFDTAPWSTAGDAVVRIGDFITYRLTLLLSGGLTQNIVVQDTLPAGMAFVETVSINADTTADFTPPSGSHFSYAAITPANVPAAGDTGALTWTIGDVVNGPTSQPPPNPFVIIYRARILPDAGTPHQDSTTLTNTASMSYNTAGGPAAPVSDSASITVVQPSLSVTKTGVAANGDTVLVVNEIVTYTVDIANTGDAPAYDPQLTDTIPVGMRNGTATITTVSMALLSGTSLPVLTPTYNATTGVVTWEYDSGVADQYTIPAGDTLRIIYRAQADTTLSAGMTLTNAAQVQHYYSMDDDDIPTHGGIDGQAQVYGPTNTSTVTFTTQLAGNPEKQNPTQLTVGVGEPFTYRITVPETPLETALLDVRIVDDLSLSAADMSFVSVTKISGSGSWTPVNTGSDTFVVIEDPTIGIDIPAGEQIVLDVTVLLDDTATNIDGLTFNNTVEYTYNQVNGDPNTQTAGGSDTTGNMTIVDVSTVTLEKSGPTTIQLETPGAYTLNFHNTSTGTAWNPTITDQIPNTDTGGMCAAGPSNVIARIFEADGTTAVSAPFTENTEFTVEFDRLASESATFCVWRFNLLSAAGGVPAGNRLIITYDLNLDPDTENGTTLTNIAGATRWYSADPNVTGADPRTYDGAITNGTPGTLDHEDAHTTTAETPVLQFDLSVVNITTGQDPGSNASPGDVLEYTIQLSNAGPVGISSFSILNDLDALNATSAFEPGTLTIVNIPSGAVISETGASGNGSSAGTVNIANLTIAEQGQNNDAITVVYQVTLAPVIDSGTVVQNQAQIITANPNPILSDDPNLPGDNDPTQTTIESAPQLQVLKTSTIMEGDPEILMAGERLRYTLTIENIGTENAVNVTLRDYVPANTSYVANSTTLNGVAVPDPSSGVSPLQAGMPINAPENTTPGYMGADGTPGGSNMATVTFDVIVNPGVMDGLVIENQGFVGSDGAGSGDQPEQPSDDPNTPIPDDPTQNVVGNLPYLYALKTVEIYQDLESPGLVDPGDALRYTFTISNLGAIPATNAVLIDAVPNNTTYVADSLRVNGVALPSDGGVLPLIAGVHLQSSDNPGEGIITPEESAVVTFEVTVDAGTPVGTIISNQGSVTTTELSPEPTDSDGLPSNGDQPTVIVVGDTQLLTITKEVNVVSEGPALAGGQLEYVIRVSNVGNVPAANMIITDDLRPPLGDQVSYVADSGTLNGALSGITYSGGVLTFDYFGQYGSLPSGDTAVVRFRVNIDSNLAIGTTITNTGEVQWSDDKSETASVSIDVGGTPDSAALNGTIWHDANFNRVDDPEGDIPETLMEGWSVELYYNGQLVTSASTDASGNYSFSGLLPNSGTTNAYEIQFHAPDYASNTASLGDADSQFTNGPQRITDIVAAEGRSLQDLNLPLWPNGVVYNSVARAPVAGATLRLLNAGTAEALPSGCFNDPVQQNQVTTQNGFYKFDLNFSDASCPSGGAYLIEVTQPATGYLDTPSVIIPPTSGAATEPFSVPACPGSNVDAVPATADYCEATVQPAVPPSSIEPRTPGTTYYLHLTFSNDVVPGHSQIFYNPIPIDPVLTGAVAITKVSALKNVTRASLVPYTITVTNVYGAQLYDMSIVDLMPPGFKYVEDSARLDGEAVEPQANGRQLIWDGLQLAVNQRYTLKLLLVVGAGVSEGEYINSAVVRNTATGTDASGKATATVRVIPDPTFDCTDVIGKVFDDRDLNGSQDGDEKGLPGVRVVTARGLISTTDEYGRFHITCATVPDEDRGSNFILKVDERSLPSGYRLTTENPRVQRATRGHMLRFNFGATIYRVVRMDISDGAFEPDSKELRFQWQPRIDQLLSELLKAPSTLRLSYLADVEKKSLVKKRLKALKKQIAKQWKTLDGGYPLTIETEVFWRRGAPFDGR